MTRGTRTTTSNATRRWSKYDDLTISVTLPESKPDILYRAALRPVPMHFYKEFADDYTEFYQWAFEPTTGPYEVRPENVSKGQGDHPNQGRKLVGER